MRSSRLVGLMMIVALAGACSTQPAAPVPAAPTAASADQSPASGSSPAPASGQWLLDARPQGELDAQERDVWAALPAAMPGGPANHNIHVTSFDVYSSALNTAAWSFSGVRRAVRAGANAPSPSIEWYFDGSYDVASKRATLYRQGQLTRVAPPAARPKAPDADNSGRWKVNDNRELTAAEKAVWNKLPTVLSAAPDSSYAHLVSSLSVYEDSTSPQAWPFFGVHSIQQLTFDYPPPFGTWLFRGIYDPRTGTITLTQLATLDVPAPPKEP
jgi:hypothetical protein